MRKISMRDAFGEAMLELGRQNNKVLALTADLGASVRLNKFAQEFPERFINFGVAEANMIGAAAGLASEGFIPYTTSFAVFTPGRCFDHIRVSVCQNKANVKIVGSHAGFSNPGDGATAQSVEDIALARVLPEMTVICPADANQVKKAVFAMSEQEGPVYLRISRAETPVFTKEEDGFEIGKAQILRKDGKVTIIACGSLGYEALQAAEEVDGEVINLHTIKPLDKETILKSVQKTGRVITIEEHSVYGGMGSAVAEFLVQEYPVPMKILGIQDFFGESARDYQQLLDKHELNAESIVKAVKEL
ncbi:MAG: transketolase family protein [Patescibacteria group bacterium]